MKQLTLRRGLAVGALSLGLVTAGIALPATAQASGIGIGGSGASTVIGSAAGDAPRAENWVQKNVTCSTGNFTGTAAVEIMRQGDLTYGKVTAYRIQKFNGQQGGNKANVNLTVGSQKTKSDDAMIQDSNWHDLRLDASAYGYTTLGFVEFIFDKSWADPRCSVAF